MLPLPTESCGHRQLRSPHRLPSFYSVPQDSSSKMKFGKHKMCSHPFVAVTAESLPIRRLCHRPSGSFHLRPFLSPRSGVPHFVVTWPRQPHRKQYLSPFLAEGVYFLTQLAPLDIGHVVDIHFVWSPHIYLCLDDGNGLILGWLVCFLLVCLLNLCVGDVIAFYSVGEYSIYSDLLVRHRCNRSYPRRDDVEQLTELPCTSPR